MSCITSRLPSAHLQLFQPKLSPDYLDGLARERTAVSVRFIRALLSLIRERQPPQLIIVGVRPWSRCDMRGFAELAGVHQH
jgi:hypothetical protein